MSSTYYFLTDYSDKLRLSESKKVEKLLGALYCTNQCPVYGLVLSLSIIVSLGLSAVARIEAITF